MNVTIMYGKHMVIETEFKSFGKEGLRTAASEAHYANHLFTFWFWSSNFILDRVEFFSLQFPKDKLPGFCWEWKREDAPKYGGRESTQASACFSRGLGQALVIIPMGCKGTLQPELWKSLDPSLMSSEEHLAWSSALSIADLRLGFLGSAKADNMYITDF